MTSISERPGSGTVQAGPPPAPVSVLIADDEDLLVQSCTRILSGEGYAAHTAGTAGTRSTCCGGTGPISSWPS